MKAFKMAQSIGRTLFIQTLDQMSKETCAQELASAKQQERSKKVEQIERQRKEKIRQETIALKAAQTMQHCVYSVLNEEVRQAASNELQRQNMLLNWTKMASAKILNDTLGEMVSREAAAELKCAKEKWRKQVQDLCDKLLKRRVRRMLLKWRDLVLLLRERRERIQRFPAGRSILNTAAQAEEMSVISPDRPATFWNKKMLKFTTSKILILILKYN
jgi:hypothetical protein